MRVLFLTDHHLDYAADALYVGLRRILGEGTVVDYPYKACFHEIGQVPWYLVPIAGRPWTREEILDRLRDKYFDLVCLASFRRESLDECAQLFGKVPFPPMVFVDGEDHAKIRHDVVERFPIEVYFKRDYVWRKGSRLRDLGALAWTFRGDRRLFERTFPLPLSIVMEALPEVGVVSKEIDVSYRGRASHPIRVRAVEILSRMEGVQFSGGIYASPDDRKYKLKTGSFERLRTKVFDDGQASTGDQQKKQAPEAYYREIAVARIAVALRGGGLTPSPRYYEIVAMKTLLISDVPKAAIPNEFVDRRHAVYCKADLSDLEDLVRRYLRDEAAREAIVQDGFAHLVKYHTCERRAEYFLDVCRRVL